MGWAWPSPWNPAGSRLTSRTVPVEPLLFPEWKRRKGPIQTIVVSVQKKKKPGTNEEAPQHKSWSPEWEAGTPWCSNHGVKEKKARVGTREPARAVPGISNESLPRRWAREGWAPQREAPLHPLPRLGLGPPPAAATSLWDESRCGGQAGFHPPRLCDCFLEAWEEAH